VTDTIKTYIIVLKESQLSVDLSTDCINAAKLFNINPIVWPAVNGLSCDSLFEKYNITVLDTKAMNNRPGTKGCFLSHYELWLECIRLNETICILEHDGYFIREIPNDIEDHFTEILKLDPYRPLIDDYQQYVNDSLSQPVDYFETPCFKSTVKGGKYSPGAYGYLIKPVAAKKLVTLAQTSGASPTDKHISIDIVDLKSSTVTIVKLHDFFITNGIKKHSSTKDLLKFI
jgi:GR25 family glycosyltransferase involved in LPS biosynthesis